jgi:hypothetical protein
VPDPPEQTAARHVELTLVPYHQWAERGLATMRVFIPIQ